MSKILEIEDVEKNITAKLNKWPIVCLRFRELWRQKVSLLAVSRTTTTSPRKVGRQIRRRKDKGACSGGVKNDGLRSRSERANLIASPLVPKEVDVASNLEVNAS